MSVLEDIIYELAEKKSDIGSKVADKSEDIIEHLIDIYFWRNTIYKNHWCAEIYGFLHSIQRLRGKNKYPKSKDIYKWVWLESENKLDLILDDVIFNVKEHLKGYESLQEPKKFDKSDIKSFVEDYMDWLSNELSKEGFASNKKIREIIDSLLKKHPYKLD